jgi:hypothetical protein
MSCQEAVCFITDIRCSDSSSSDSDVVDCETLDFNFLVDFDFSFFRCLLEDFAAFEARVRNLLFDGILESREVLKHLCSGTFTINKLLFADYH